MPDLFDPTDSRPLHFVGASGAGMSALALAARRRGAQVTGSDPDATAFADLNAAGITTHVGHDASHVVGARAVIATAAVRDDHVELRAAREHGIPIVRRKDALAQLVNGKQLVAIAGTHGKTTTTVMTTEALRGAGLHPTGLAGGRVSTWGGNALLDGDDLFVVEADEYDQAFLTLQPTVAVVNNVEPDHLECYGSIDAMERAFITFASRASTILIGNADGGSDRVAAAIGPNARRFGIGAHGFHLSLRDTSEDGSRAAVTFPDGASVELRIRVPGMHNLRNATAALAVTWSLQANVGAALEALANFTGVGRRFERLGTVAGVTLVDDYAHHPTELSATLAAARQAYPQRRVIAVFQPHLYSRTRDHADAMGEALASADLVMVTDVYGAREQPIAGVTGKLVADAAVRAGGNVMYQPDRERIPNDVNDLLAQGDVLLTLGAGDITRVGPDVRSMLERR